MQVERKIVSSFTACAILPKAIFRASLFVRRFADAKNTAFGARGKAIRHEELSSGIPQGYIMRGYVNRGRSPIKIAGVGQRLIHQSIPHTVASFLGSVLRSIAALSGKFRWKVCMFLTISAVTLRSSS